MVDPWVTIGRVGIGGPMGEPIFHDVQAKLHMAPQISIGHIGRKCDSTGHNECQINAAFHPSGGGGGVGMFRSHSELSSNPLVASGDIIPTIAYRAFESIRYDYHT